MSRRHLEFTCESETLVGTLDEGNSRVGLLIVTGGNENRSGSFSGQAQLAARVAADGHPVFRFDRRGVGDSSGDNLGFRKCGPDIAKAVMAFQRECPALARIVAFGNCDAASALLLNGGSRCDALVLANPWTFEDDQADELPPQVARAHYAGRLRSLAHWRRLSRGDVPLGQLGWSLLRTIVPQATNSTLARSMSEGLDRFGKDVRFLVAGSDRTGMAFLSVWEDDPRIVVRDNADHAFSDSEDSAWLVEQLLSALHEQARKLDMG